MKHGKRMRNRPDLVRPRAASRVYVEWDYSPPSRAMKHKRQYLCERPECGGLPS